MAFDQTSRPDRSPANAGDSSATGRVERWRRAWQGYDPDQVAALYDSDSTHTSAAVAGRMGELGRNSLHGPAEMRDYAARVFATVPGLSFEILGIVSGGAFDVVEYRRSSALAGDRPALVAEVLEWCGDRLKSVRVYHI